MKREPWDYQVYELRIVGSAGTVGWQDAEGQWQRAPDRSWFIRVVSPPTMNHHKTTMALSEFCERLDLVLVTTYRHWFRTMGVFAPALSEWPARTGDGQDTRRT